jgi:hypothetical protein
MGEGNENLVYPSRVTSRVLLHAVKSYDMGPSGFTSHPRGSVLRIFIALKNKSPWPGSNPQTLGPVASTLTTTLLLVVRRQRGYLVARMARSDLWRQELAACWPLRSLLNVLSKQCGYLVARIEARSDLWRQELAACWPLRSLLNVLSKQCGYTHCGRSVCNQPQAYGAQRGSLAKEPQLLFVISCSCGDG